MNSNLRSQWISGLFHTFRVQCFVGNEYEFLCIYSYEKDKAFFENWYLILVLRIFKKLSGLLQSAEIPLSTLEISGCCFLPFSSRLIFDYKGEETPKSLFQNQWATSAPLLSMPYKLQRPYSKQGFISVCKGMQPLSSSSPDQTVWTVLTHIYLYNLLYLS